MPVQGSDDARYVVVFDPLDGSSNIDASIPTGEAILLSMRFVVRLFSALIFPEAGR